MNGLVSLLPQPHYDQVLQLWHSLETRFGIQTGQISQYPPHISWLTVNDFPLKNLEIEFRSLASKNEPFQIRTSGIGVFSRPKPVIYITVIKDDSLTKFHHQIWQLGQSHIPEDQIIQLYNPTFWLPHITLINIEPAPSNLGEILSELSYSPFQWEMTIDHIAFLCPQSGDTGMQLCQIPLGK